MEFSLSLEINRESNASPSQLLCTSCSQKNDQYKKLTNVNNNTLLQINTNSIIILFDTDQEK